MGKVLIVLQVVFSFCFMAFAGAVYTAQVNWKAKSDTLTQDVSKARSALQEAQTAMQTADQNFQNEKMALESRALTAERDLDDTRRELQNLQDQFTQVDTLKETLGAQATLSQKEADARLEESKSQRDINNELLARLVQNQQELRDAKDQIFALNKEMEEMEVKHQEALNDIATYKLLAEANGWVKDPKVFLRSQTPPPVVRGLVHDARPANDRGTETLVEISIGERDGLAEGHELFAYRPASRNSGRAQYLGKIRLLSVSPDKAVGVVTEAAKNGLIEKGDHVTTQL